MQRSLLIGLLVCTICACTSEESTPPNRWADAELRTIYDLQDKRDTQGILPYLSHENSTYREAAALAFGSVQDSVALPYLAEALNDSKIEVRTAAAYSIGQTRHPQGFDILYNGHANEPNTDTRATLLEAMGKCADEESLEILITIPTSTPAEIEGKLWGIYRAGLNRVVLESGTDFVLQQLSASEDGVRLAGAHYLNRANLDLSGYASLLGQVAKQDVNAEVRMALVGALRKADAPGVGNDLAAMVAEEIDPNVRVNAWRSLKAEHLPLVEATIPSALASTDPNEAVAAADYLAKLDATELERVLSELSLGSVAFRPKARILGIAITKQVPGDYRNQLLESIQNSTQRYEKAAYIGALGNEWDDIAMINELISSASDPAISTAAVSALGKLLSREVIPTEYHNTLVSGVQAAFQKQDLASVALASGYVLQDNLQDFLSYWQAPEFVAAMQEAKAPLELPSDVETLMVLQDALDYVEGNFSQASVTNPYNHPINWDRLSTVPSDQKVVLTTSKGTIEWTLQVDDAPGSVESFLSLVEAGYYDGKTLHRVVPNFVAQGGCPRGDGYGGQDYSIRSEFAPLQYTTGAVGLASAGKDTESCQWFITHSPTPHLDGRYTIFAYVTEGQAVAQQLEQGDVIESITIVP